MKYTFIIVGSVILLIAVFAYVYFSFFANAAEPEYIDPTSTLEGVSIQPKQALQLAEPFLEEHATVVFNKEEPLKTHIVSQNGWYYVMRTNYPVKTFRFYMQPAVKINMTTGEVEFSVK